MDMKKWIADLRKAGKKKTMPVLSFPSVQLMGITVRELIASAESQAAGMKLIADRVDAAASVSLMDLSVEARHSVQPSAFQTTRCPPSPAPSSQTRMKPRRCGFRR